MFPALEGLRALGALSVATAHSWPSMVRDLSWFNGSYAVVEMFFVLSGYLVTRAYGERVTGWRDVGVFATRRLGRLYPLHMAVLLAWVGIFYGKQILNMALAAFGIDLGMTPAASQASFDWQYFMLNIGLLHGLGIQNSLAFNFPSWSVSAEFAAFLLVMAVFAITGSRSARIKAAGLGLGLCVLHFVWTFAVGEAVSLTAAPVMNEPLVARGITRSGAAYFIGVLAFEWQRNHHLGASAWQHSIVQGLILVCLLVLIPNQSVIPLAQLWAAMLWAMLIISLCSGVGWLVCLLSLKPMVWLGQRSYAVYITHGLLLLLVQRRVVLLADDSLLNFAYFIYLPACVGLAALAHHFIEGPCYLVFGQWADRLAKAGSKAAVSPARVQLR